MTRAKKTTYILYNEKKPSPFIGEFITNIEAGSYLCPKCLEGMLVTVKEGTASNGNPYRMYKCSNMEAGCDFFQTRFGNVALPGILITEDMTLQDIEHLRESRRKARRMAIRNE